VEKYEKAIQQCQYRLFTAIMVFFTLFFRCILSQLMEDLGSNTSNDGDSNNGIAIRLAIFANVFHAKSEDVFSWIATNAMRLSLGMVIMSIIVTQCFIGPFSIVQCSIIPLPTNPIDGIMRKIISHLVSPGTFLQSLANPDAKQSTTNNTNHQNIRNINQNRATTNTTKKLSGIRFQRPTVIQTFAQVLLHAIGGVLCAHLIIVPAMIQQEEEEEEIGDNNYNNNFTKLLISTSCSFILVAIYIALHVSNKNEMSFHDPSIISSLRATKNIKSLLWKFVNERFRTTIRESGIIWYWAVTPLFSLASLHFFSSPTNSIVWKDTLLSLPVIYLITSFITVYVMILHIMVHIVLTVKGLNADRIISTNTLKYNEYDQYTVEDLMVESILSGFCTQDEMIDTCLPEAKVKGRSGAYGNTNLEQEEMMRNDKMMKIVADSILDGMACLNTRVYHDLLTVLLLESIGGNDGKGNEDYLDIPKRHLSFLLRRLNHQMVSEVQILQQPPIVPVLRALFAYTGGLGEALSDLMLEVRLNKTVGGMTWSLPPCTLMSLEYAVRGTARLIALNLCEKPEMISTRKRHSRVSILIPTFFAAVFKLRCGLLDYAEYLTSLEEESNNSNTDTEIENRIMRNNGQVWIGREESSEKALLAFIALKYSDLHKTLNVCDESATIVKEAVKGRTYAVENIPADCHKWIFSIASATEK